MVSHQPYRVRLLFVAAFPPPDLQVYGGMVTDCRSLLQSTLPRRVELILVDSTQRSNPPPSVPKRVWYAIGKFFRFAITLARERPDAVLLFTSSPVLSTLEKGVMARYAALRGIPVLMFPRGGRLIDNCARSAFMRLWVRWLFKRVNIFLCQGEAWRTFALDTLRFSPGSTRLVPNWTARDSLLMVGSQRRFVPSVKPLRLLFAGWLEREKGVLELLEACKILSSELSFELCIAGEGHASQEARQLVAEWGLEGSVQFMGWLSEPEMLVAYQQADIFVLPSWAEGLPNVVIEAMAAGLAIVVSAVGNIHTTFVQEEHALLIPPKDVMALANALRRVMTDGSLRERLARQGHAFVSQAFSVEPAVDRMVEAVHDAIAMQRTMR